MRTDDEHPARRFGVCQQPAHWTTLDHVPGVARGERGSAFAGTFVGRVRFGLSTCPSPRTAAPPARSPMAALD
jgi:hypothetical protein